MPTFSMAPSNVRRTLATFSTDSRKIEQSQIPRDLEVFMRVQKCGGSESSIIESAQSDEWVGIGAKVKGCSNTASFLTEI